ncbi:MAG TPA: hypothetical protein VK604_25665 [Bryobacteraceae bacterium]|nr:hypothetical protein [Bryobacteraceae bacterium]
MKRRLCLTTMLAGSAIAFAGAAAPAATLIQLNVDLSVDPQPGNTRCSTISKPSSGPRQASSLDMSI